MARPERDFSAKAVMLWGILLVGFLCVLAALLLFYQRSEVPTASRSSPLAPVPGSPLQEDEFESGKLRREWEERERKGMLSYGWIDRERGIVRIPVERALELQSGRIR